MIIDSPIISGSTSATGSLNQVGNVTITGSLTVTGAIIGAVTGSVDSASFAANAALLNNKNSGEFVPTGSFNAFSSSILSYTGSNNTNIDNLNVTSASLNTFTGSASSRLSSIESTTGSLNTASGSAITRLNALEVTSGSNITRISALESASGSAITRLSALESASGSAITRLNAIEVVTGSNISRLSSLESKTGSYATTGSNTFVSTQYISASNNPTGFTTTASLYTDGGLRVTRDAYISGTLYLNNVTVYGTQSVAYITSSQLNIASNLITVNTATPSVQFGGLAVYDSGSSGLTGSILWDSTNNRWVYSNPSGSSYDGGMLISGPRNSSGLGNEVGTTSCALMMGQGGDHITSSAITHYSTATCFYGNAIINSTGSACFAGTVCASNITSAGTICSTGNTCVGGMSVVASCLGVGTATPDIFSRGDGFDVGISSAGVSSTQNMSLQLNAGATAGRGAQIYMGQGGTRHFTISSNTTESSIGTTSNTPLRFVTCDSLERLRITNTGIACFACQVCAPTLIGTTVCLSTAICATYGFFPGISIGGNPASAGTGATAMRFTNSGGDLYLGQESNTAGNFYPGSKAYDNVFYTTCPFNFIFGGGSKFYISAAGVGCFASTVCTPQAIIRAGASTCVYASFGATSVYPINLSGGGNPYYGTQIAMGADAGSCQLGMRIWTRYNSAVGSGVALTIEASTTCQGYGGDPTTLSYTELFRITCGGNVGIGTASPVRKLDIISTSEQLRLAYDTSGVYSDFRNDSAGGLLINTSGAYIINYIGGNAKMRIDASATCFSCQVCTPNLVINGSTACVNINRTDGTPAILQLGNTSNAYQIQYTCTGGQRLAFINGAPTEYASFFGTGVACFSGRVCASALSADGAAIRYADFQNYSFQIGTDTFSGGFYVYQPAGYRLTIKDGGVAVFACQICVGGMVALTNTSFGTPVTEAAYRIRMYDNGGINNDPGIGLDGSGGGGEVMWFNALGGFYFNYGTNGAKIKFDGSGGACFSQTIYAGSSILPLSNGTQDLGSSTCRWCTVYTSDLSLNNGIGNYTIVEGENDLFLYNNNSCKVFKFLLQEVCPEIAPAKRSI